MIDGARSAEAGNCVRGTQQRPIERAAKRSILSLLITGKLFPDRFKNLEKLYYDLLPVEGILEEHTEQDFYLELIKLHQTTSLT